MLPYEGTPDQVGRSVGGRLGDGECVARERRAVIRGLDGWRRRRNAATTSHVRNDTCSVLECAGGDARAGR